MALDLGSSKSDTRASTDNAQIGASDQATAIQLKGKGSKTVGSTINKSSGNTTVKASGNTTVKIGKGGTYTVTNQDRSGEALQAITAALGRTVDAQANLATGERKNTTTGLAVPEAPASTLNQKNLMIGGVVLLVLGVLAFALRR